MNKLNERFRNLLKEKKIKNPDLEKKTGIKSSIWHNIRNKKSRVNEDHLEAVFSLYPEEAYWITTGIRKVTRTKKEINTENMIIGLVKSKEQINWGYILNNLEKKEKNIIHKLLEFENTEQCRRMEKRKDGPNIKEKIQKNSKKNYMKTNCKHPPVSG